MSNGERFLGKVKSFLLPFLPIIKLKNHKNNDIFANSSFATIGAVTSRHKVAYRAIHLQQNVALF